MTKLAIALISVLSLSSPACGGSADPEAPASPDGGGQDVEPCPPCADGETCVDGACVEPACGPETCTGCCSGDACLSGDSAAACGAAGQACTDCGDGFSCEAGSCQVALDSRWALTVLSATLSETNVADEPWDEGGGLPDAHVDVFAGRGDEAVLATSGMDDDTLSPEWSEVLLSDVPARLLLDRLAFRLVDVDPLGDDRIGECQVILDSGAFDGSDQTLHCPRDLQEEQAGFTLSYRLTPR